jgi:6-phosphofructokinase
LWKLWAETVVGWVFHLNCLSSFLRIQKTALFGALATAADWVLIPEFPIEGNWKENMAKAIRKGKEMGRRSSIVIMAEGAKDYEGNPITSQQVKQVPNSSFHFEL